MEPTDLRGGKEAGDHTIYISCSRETFDGWREFAEGYTDYEEQVGDIVSTWRSYPNSFDLRSSFDTPDWTGSEKTIYIRCSADTLTKWKEYAAGYNTYEEAARDAVEAWRTDPSLFAGRMSTGTSPG